MPEIRLESYFEDCVAESRGLLKLSQLQDDSCVLASRPWAGPAECSEPCGAEDDAPQGGPESEADRLRQAEAANIKAAARLIRYFFPNALFIPGLLFSSLA